MDRALERHVIRAATFGKAWRAALAIAGVAVLVVGARQLLTPSLARGTFRTARVDSGPIEATLDASGTVVPEREEIVSSPIDARVLRLIQRPGAKLGQGDAIVELDTGEQRLKVQTLAKDLAVKQAQLAKARLDLKASVVSLESQLGIKKLQLEVFQNAAGRNRKLRAEGLIWAETAEQSELDVARTELELKQLREQVRLAEESARSQLHATQVEIDNLEESRKSAERDLDRASTKSRTAGVLTDVSVEPGATVRRGDVLARVADLSSYRVVANVSDIHAQRLAQGQPALVSIGDATLNGEVSRVLPSIQNGVVKVEISLANAADERLRPNLRVDVHVVVDRRTKALRLERGFTAGDGKNPEVFVVRGDRAVRSPVKLGLASFERNEIVEGLREGDEVIVSDMREHAHLQSIAIH